MELEEGHIKMFPYSVLLLAKILDITHGYEAVEWNCGMYAMSWYLALLLKDAIDNTDQIIIF